MKFAGQLVFLIFISALARADDLAMADRPYSAITERNVFALVPIPTNAPVDTSLADPPLKITPNGIMNLFGQLEVLFKVAVPARAGQPAKEVPYVMGEGERQDDIEVTKIDEKNAIISFINHGVAQDLPLAEAPKSTTPASSGGVPMPTLGRGIPLPRGPNRGDGPQAVGGGPAARANASNSSNSEPSTASSRIYDPSAELKNQPVRTDLTPEEEIALKYLDAKSQNNSVADLLPLTSEQKNAADEVLKANTK